MTFEEWKKRFDAEVDESHISYDWDAGWCYSIIHHPLMDELYKLQYGSEEHDKMTQYANDWLSTHDGEYFHMANVKGDKLVSQDPDSPFEGEEAKRQARGLISYIEKYHSDSEFYKPKVAELKKFLGE